MDALWDWSHHYPTVCRDRLLGASRRCWEIFSELLSFSSHFSGHWALLTLFFFLWNSPVAACYILGKRNSWNSLHVLGRKDQIQTCVKPLGPSQQFLGRGVCSTKRSCPQGLAGRSSLRAPGQGWAGQQEGRQHCLAWQGHWYQQDTCLWCGLSPGTQNSTCSRSENSLPTHLNCPATQGTEIYPGNSILARKKGWMLLQGLLTWPWRSVLSSIRAQVSVWIPSETHNSHTAGAGYSPSHAVLVFAVLAAQPLLNQGQLLCLGTLKNICSLQLCRI